MAAQEPATAPLVSVVVPTYKRAAKIVRSLESALQQTYQNLEIVVVDDASNDGTDAVIAALNEPRITYVSHETNRGGNAARNTGIAASTGRYVAFLDSDDTWMPTKVESQVAALEERGEEFGLCYTWYDVRTPDGALVSTQKPVVYGRESVDLFVANWIGGYSTVLVRRDALERVGGLDESLPACQDWDLYQRLNEITSFCFVPEALVEYCLDLTEGVRISAKREAVRTGHWAIFQRVADHKDDIPDDVSRSAMQNFLKIFAGIGAGSEYLGVIRTIPARLWDPTMVRTSVRMGVRCMRKQLTMGAHTGL